MSDAPVYRGSVKDIFSRGEGELEFVFSDAYSVFDWGRMPDMLLGKGQALASMSEFFFLKLSSSQSWSQWSTDPIWKMAVAALECSALAIPQDYLHSLYSEIELLKQSGLKTHFIKRPSANSILVKKVSVEKPKERVWFGARFYDYSGVAEKNNACLVPLEVVFRFGTPKGSSLLERASLGKGLSELGLAKPPVEGAFLDHAVVEFFSKLENKDRLLSVETAFSFANLSTGINFQNFSRISILTLLVGLALQIEFSKIGLELWDGKLEWAVEGGEPILVDSVGPDELRLIHAKTGVQASKEMLRLHYRKTNWFEVLQKTKEKGVVQWRNQILANFGPPPALPTELKIVAAELYPAIAGALVNGKVALLDQLMTKAGGILGK